MIKYELISRRNKFKNTEKTKHLVFFTHIFYIYISKSIWNVILNSKMHICVYLHMAFRSCQIKTYFRSTLVFSIHRFCIVSNYSLVTLPPTTLYLVKLMKTVYSMRYLSSNHFYKNRTIRVIAKIWRFCSIYTFILCCLFFNVQSFWTNI